jgi:hypothetical protein
LLQAADSSAAVHKDGRSPTQGAQPDTSNGAPTACTSPAAGWTSDSSDRVRVTISLAALSGRSATSAQGTSKELSRSSQYLTGVLANSVSSSRQAARLPSCSAANPAKS